MIGLAHWMESSPLGRALRPLIAPDGQPLGMPFTSGAYAATVSAMTTKLLSVMEFSRMATPVSHQKRPRQKRNEGDQRQTKIQQNRQSRSILCRS
jgi:hypothetical protein